MAKVTSYGLQLSKSLTLETLDDIRFHAMTKSDAAKANKNAVRKDTVELATWIVTEYERVFFSATDNSADSLPFSSLNLGMFGKSGSRGVLDYSLVNWFTKAQAKEVLPFTVKCEVHEGTGSWLFICTASPMMHARRDYERKIRAAKESDSMSEDSE